LEHQEEIFYKVVYNLFIDVLVHAHECVAG